MHITNMVSMATLDQVATVTSVTPGDSLLQLIDMIQSNQNLLLTPDDEWISAEFFNGPNNIDGLSISHNDDHPNDAYAFMCLDEHIAGMAKVYPPMRDRPIEWTHGVLYIARGNPSSANGKFLMHVIEFDKERK